MIPDHLSGAEYSPDKKQNMKGGQAQRLPIGGIQWLVYASGPIYLLLDPTLVLEIHGI